MRWLAGLVVVAALLVGCAPDYGCEEWINGEATERPDRATRDYCLDYWQHQ